MTLWMIRGGTNDVYLPACREYGVALLGFGPLGDLTKVTSKAELRAKIAAAYHKQDKAEGTISKWAGEIWSFIGEMRAGDGIIMPYQTGQRLMLGRWLDGRYRYRKDLSDEGRHVRPVQWIGDVDRQQISTPLWEQLKGRCTVKRLSDDRHEFAQIAGEPAQGKQVGIEAPDSASEGERWQRERMVLSRSTAIVQKAWATNIEVNAGIGCCEVCSFQSVDRGMFDVHHLTPVALGRRETKVDDLAVLCPRCHRQAHRKPGTAPFSLIELRSMFQK